MLGKLPDRDPTEPLVLAVDGGASKVDIALVSATGRVLAAVRRPGIYHFGLDHQDSLKALTAAMARVVKRGPARLDHEAIAAVGVYCLAGADIPLDDRRIAAEVGGQGWTVKTIIRNDTFAVLRAGTDRKWGVALVCGTGLNCAGVGPDGSVVRFPSFGELSGDRAHGGGWLGRSALGVAIRARDGRGPRTLLEQTVPKYFGMSRPAAVMESIYTGRLDNERLSELAPLVFQAARQGDTVARGLVGEVEQEIVVTINAAIRRLHLTKRDLHVVLGGGVLRGADARMLARIRNGIQAVAPDAAVLRLNAPPVLGAALIGLDELRASQSAHGRLRAALTQRRFDQSLRRGDPRVMARRGGPR